MSIIDDLEYAFNNLHEGGFILLTKKDWQTLKAAVLAQQTNNKQSTPCQHQFVYREYIGQTPGRCICGAIVP